MGLTGLENVASVGGNLNVSSNDNIASLDGLASLTAVGGTAMWVTLNPLLPYCEVCDLLDQLADVPGTLSITDNQPDACWSGELVCI